MSDPIRSMSVPVDTASMKDRFQGADGRRLLVDLLRRQDIVEHNADLAGMLLENGELVEFQQDETIVVQDAADNDVYFLISGEANVFVNDRFVASRQGGTSIGEMAAIDSAAPRSATVRAKGPVLALKVAASAFSEALDAHPTSYRPVARLVSDRLRQRSSFHKPPNPEPVLFIGCSTEMLDEAREIQNHLKHDRIEAIIWTDGVFKPSGVTLDSLTSVVTRSDFAAFLFAPDDILISRNEEFRVPRDNVVFELGLSIGMLGRERVFIVMDSRADIKSPSDLLGITPVTYVMPASNNLASAMATVANDIRKVIKELNVH